MLDPLRSKPESRYVAHDLIKQWCRGHPRRHPRTNLTSNKFHLKRALIFTRSLPVLPEVESYRSTSRLCPPPECRPTGSVRCCCRPSQWCPSQRGLSGRRGRTATEERQWQSVRCSLPTTSLYNWQQKEHVSWQVLHISPAVTSGAH